MPQHYPDLPSENSGGTTTTTSTPTTSSSTPSGPSGPSPQTLARLRAGYREVLRRWGLRPTKNLLNLIERAVRGMWSTTQFIDMLRQMPEYRQQFRGIQWRTGMTEGQYLATYAQYKERAQDIGVNLTKRMFAGLLRNGKTFEEFSDQVDAISTIDQYAPFWDQFRQTLELRGIAVPGGKLTKKELAKFVMGLGDKKWEQVWQETFLTVQLERVAGVEVVAPRAGETRTPDTYGIMRSEMLKLIKQVEALNPGLEVEKLSGRQFTDLGKRLRGYSLEYMRRYGLDTLDILEMELGGPRGAAIAEKAERVLKTQEAFLEPRATPLTLARTFEPQPQELPQSR